MPTQPTPPPRPTLAELWAADDARYREPLARWRSERAAAKRDRDKPQTEASEGRAGRHPTAATAGVGAPSRPHRSRRISGMGAPVQSSKSCGTSGTAGRRSCRPSRLSCPCRQPVRPSPDPPSGPGLSGPSARSVVGPVRSFRAAENRALRCHQLGSSIGGPLGLPSSLLAFHLRARLGLRCAAPADRLGGLARRLGSVTVLAVVRSVRRRREADGGHSLCVGWPVVAEQNAGPVRQQDVIEVDAATVIESVGLVHPRSVTGFGYPPDRVLNRPRDGALDRRTGRCEASVAVARYQRCPS